MNHHHNKIFFTHMYKLKKIKFIPLKLIYLIMSTFFFQMYKGSSFIPFDHIGHLRLSKVMGYEL